MTPVGYYRSPLVQRIRRPLREQKVNRVLTGADKCRNVTRDWVFNSLNWIGTLIDMEARLSIKVYGGPAGEKKTVATVLACACGEAGSPGLACRCRSGVSFVVVWMPCLKRWSLACFTSVDLFAGADFGGFSWDNLQIITGTAFIVTLGETEPPDLSVDLSFALLVYVKDYCRTAGGLEHRTALMKKISKLVDRFKETRCAGGKVLSVLDRPALIFGATEGTVPPIRDLVIPLNFGDVCP